MFHVVHKTPMGVLFEVDVAASCIQEVVDVLQIPVTKYPTIAFQNGIVIKRAHWKTIDLDPSSLYPESVEQNKGVYVLANPPKQTITFLTIPQGDFFKNILGLIATIALTLVAPYAAGVLASTLNITSQLGIQLLQAGIVLAGSFLIGTFLSPSAVGPSSKGEQASPTYSLSGQGNTARLFDVIPKQYGYHMIYPDYASGPYSEYIGNQQYINQLFCLGLGGYQIHEGRIEDTSFWNETEGYLDTFEGITIEIVPPGSPVTLFHSQVISSVEVSGQDMLNWQISTKSFIFTTANKRFTATSTAEGSNFRQAVIGQKIQVMTGANAGHYTISSIASDVSWIEVVEAFPSNSTYSTTIQMDQDENWVGPYVANTADTVTNKIQIDYIFNQGLFYASDNAALADNSAGVRAEARLINSAGVPIGSWFLLGETTYVRKTNTPQRFTESFDVVDGRYEVRTRRTDFESVSSRKKSSVQWGGLKAFIPNDNLYPDVTLVAVRMLATGQLTSTSSKKVNFIQTAKVPIYNAMTETWSAPTASRSIAWAAADIVRNTVYGAGYFDAYIDLDKLVDLDTKWTARGDTFNGIFDTTYSIWDALTAVLRVGRTSPIMVAGKITFTRDEARTIPRGVFTPAEIMRGSFETQHIIYDDESPDDIIIQFVDERTWKQNEVQCTQALSLSEKPERMQIFGITDRSQAWREGMFIGAVNAKRRIVASFSTEMEGRMLMRGDMIVAAHDLYDWGQTGWVSGYVSGTRELWTTEPLIWNSLTSQYILLRKRNGKGWGPVKINKPASDSDASAIVDATDLAIVEASQGSIVSTFNLEDDGAITSYVIVEASTDYKQWILVSGKPQDEVTQLTALIEDPSVHLVDTGSPPPDSYPFNPNEDPTRPVITAFSGAEDILSNPNAPTVIFNWAAATTAPQYQLQISYDNIVWQIIYFGPATTFTTQTQPGTVYSRVRGINTQAGNFKTYQAVYGISTTTPLPTSDIVVDYSVEGGTISIRWEAAIRATSYRMNLYSELVPGSGNYNNLAISKTTNLTSVQIGSLEVENAGGPWPNVRIGITSINVSGESEQIFETVNGVTMDPVRNLGIASTYARSTFTAQWSAQNADSFELQVIVDGVTKLTYVTYTNTQVITTDDMTAVGGPWRLLTLSAKAKAGSLESSPSTKEVVAGNILPITGAAGSITANNVKLDWFQTPDNGVPKTRVYHSTSNVFGGASIINTQTKTAGASATYTHSGQAPGNHYYWITAWDDVRSAESTPVAIVATVAALPSSLASFTITNSVPYTGYLSMAWTTGAGAVASVKIFRKTAGATLNPLVDTPLTTVASSPSTGYTYTDGDATKTNLYSNWDFSGGSTGYTLGAGWSVGSGAASRTLTAASNLSQTATIPSGNIRSAFSVTAYTSGQVRARLAGGTTQNGTYRSAIGIYSDTLVSLGDNTSLMIGADGSFVGSISYLVAYQPSGTSVAFGLYDYYAVPFNSQGMNGTPSSLLNVRIY